MKQRNLWIPFVVFILLCATVSLVGSLWTKEGLSTWYLTLRKPIWTPPDWVFGPVWTLLYSMIAISGWLIYKGKRSYQRSMALRFYGGQLVLNFMWSFFFFSLRSPILGLIDIVLLSILIVLTIINGWRVSSLAGILLIPYLIWVLYAATLNAGILLLNG